MNLWKETIDVLKSKGFSFNDVLVIYGDDFQITKENFEKVAKKTDYDNGFGMAEIAIDLKILGKDFIMYREEYDGSEWWKLDLIGNSIPNKCVTINNLTGAWNTVKQILEKR